MNDELPDSILNHAVTNRNVEIKKIFSQHSKPQEANPMYMTQQ